MGHGEVIDFCNRILRPPPRTVGVRAGVEISFENGLQNLPDGLLDHPVAQGGDTQITGFATSSVPTATNGAAC